jgi:chitinase
MRVLPVLTAVLLLLAGCTGPDRPRPDDPPPTSATSPRVVGYFTDWGVYSRNYQVKNLETSGAARRLTHIMYAFGKVSAGRCAVRDSWADYQRPVAASDSVDGAATSGGNFGQLRKLKERHPGLKLIWSFGGWSDSAGFAEAARDPATFARSCADLIRDRRWDGLFDGVDIDWEYPNACGLACDTSGPDALGGLVKDLRRELGPDRIVTAAVAADRSKLAATDYSDVAGDADWLNVMTYDFFGTGSTPGPTAPHSPLTAYPGIPRETATTDAAIRALRGYGVPASKILLGVGFYGRGWTGVGTAAPGSRATGPAPGTYEKGMEDYNVLSQSCPPTGVVGGTAYAFCRGQWWSYDTPQTIRAKMAYARSNGLGGSFAWELSGDTADAQLVRAMSDGLSPA